MEGIKNSPHFTNNLMSSEEIQNIKQNITDIRQNHLVHIEKDINDIKIEQAKHGIDLRWLKKFFFIVAGASIGSLIAAIINLI